MYKALLAITLLPLLIFATPNPNDILSVTEGEPELNIAQSVNPLTGDFFVWQEDLVIQGAEPLPIRRIYIASQGWSYVPHQKITVFGKEQLLAPEASGAMVFYDRKKTKKGHGHYYSCTIPEHGKGVVNTARGVISGRTNLKNNIIYKDDHNSRRMVCADGSERYYEAYKIKKHRYSSDLYLKWERLSNGNQIYYSYDNQHRLLEIATKNPSGNKTYASARFVYHNNSNDFDIHTSDGRIIQYRHEGPSSNLLATVVSPELPPENLSYLPSRVITKRSLPEGRSVYPQYHSSTPSLHSRVSSLLAPAGPHGEQVEIHRFDYKQKKRKELALLDKAFHFASNAPCSFIPASFVGPERESFRDDPPEPSQQQREEEANRIRQQEEHKRYLEEIIDVGQTDIFDAHNRKTTLFYNRDTYRTDAIQYFDANNLLHHTIYSQWNEWGELLSKRLTDNYNQEIWKRSFHYDTRGNILLESFTGNLTGEGVSSYHKHFAYSPDNYLLHQEEDNGTIIDYTYKIGTNLLTSKITANSSGILIREFFVYDNDNLLVRQITDNGATKDPNNLSGVTERKIEHIQVRQSQPALGLPEIIEERYWNPSTGAEELLKKVVLHYSAEARVIQKDFYNDQNRFCYSEKTTYNSMGYPIEKIDALGQITKQSYDIFGNLTLEEEPGSALKKQMSYDANNRLIEETLIGSDGSSRSHKHSYDTKNNKTQTLTYQNQIVSYAYDAFNHLIKQSDPAFPSATKEMLYPQTTFTFNVLGKESSKTDANGFTTETTYNCRADPILTIHPDGTRESFLYYPDGKLRSAVNQEGTTTSYTYDTLNRPLTKKIYSATNELLSEESFVYNSFHLLSHTDAGGLTTHYEYDPAGRLRAKWSQTESGIEKTLFTYDSLGRLHTTQTEELITITEYDYLDREIEKRQEENSGEILTQTLYTYDIAGNLVQTSTLTSQGLATETTEYDPYKRPLKKSNALGETTTFTYNDSFLNESNQMVCQTTCCDPMGVATIETLDTHNRSSSVEIRSPGGDLLSREEFYYDSASNKTAQTSYILAHGTAKVKTTTWVYDSFKHVLSCCEADSTELARTTLYSYTPAGKIAEEIKPDSTTLFYKYDPLGRLLSLVSSDGSCNQSFTYNSLDLIISATDHNNKTTIRREYDAKGRLVSEELPQNLLFSSSYDTRGRRTRFCLPDNSYILYQYGPLYLRSITKYTPNHEELFTHTYQTFETNGQPLSQRLIANLGSITTHYDILRRPLSLDAPCKQQMVLQRDAHGNVLTLKNGTRNNYYTYSDLSQLLSEQGDTNHTYTYDSHDNRISKDNSSFDIDLLNHFSDTTYDLNGNPVENQKQLYQYDALGRLLSLTQGTTTFTFTYDPFHRRLSKTITSPTKNGTHYYLYDEKDEIGAATSDGTIFELRTLGIGKGAEIGATVAIELYGELYAPIHDLFGSITNILSARTGAQAARYAYSAFGEEYTTSALPIPWRYHSKRRDESGLIYYGRRYYNPSQGRWLTPDPKGFTDGPNLYAFVHANPLRNIDLYGLLTQNATLPNFADVPQKIFINDFQIETDPKLLNDNVNHLTDLIVRDSHSHLHINRPDPSNKKICFMHGIFNSQSNNEESSLYLSDVSGGYDVHATFKRGFGIGNCLYRFGNRYKPGSTARRIKREWKEFFENNSTGYLLQICHSGGSIEVRDALRMSKPAIREKIIVVAIAPAVYISSRDCAQATNYKSTRDFVPGHDSVSKNRCLPGDIVLLRPHSDAAFWDHSFNSPTYRDVLQDHIKEYLNTPTP